MTLILVTEKPLSTAEAKAKTLLLGKAKPLFDHLLKSHGMPARDAWWLTTFYQPKSFRKTWRSTETDELEAYERLNDNLSTWCAEGQYPYPVVVTLGKTMADIVCGDGFDYDDLDAPLKKFEWPYIVFPMYAEPELFYKAHATPTLLQSFHALRRFLDT